MAKTSNWASPLSPPLASAAGASSKTMPPPPQIVLFPEKKREDSFLTTGSKAGKVRSLYFSPRKTEAPDLASPAPSTSATKKEDLPSWKAKRDRWLGSPRPKLKPLPTTESLKKAKAKAAASATTKSSIAATNNNIGTASKTLFGGTAKQPQSTTTRDDDSKPPPTEASIPPSTTFNMAAAAATGPFGKKLPTAQEILDNATKNINEATATKPNLFQGFGTLNAAKETNTEKPNLFNGFGKFSEGAKPATVGEKDKTVKTYNGFGKLPPTGDGDKSQQTTTPVTKPNLFNGFGKLATPGEAAAATPTQSTTTAKQITPPLFGGSSTNVATPITTPISSTAPSFGAKSTAAPSFGAGAFGTTSSSKNTAKSGKDLPVFGGFDESSTAKGPFAKGTTATTTPNSKATPGRRIVKSRKPTSTTKAPTAAAKPAAPKNPFASINLVASTKPLTPPAEAAKPAAPKNPFASINLVASTKPLAPSSGGFSSGGFGALSSPSKESAASPTKASTESATTVPSFGALSLATPIQESGASPTNGPSVSETTVPSFGALSLASPLQESDTSPTKTTTATPSTPSFGSPTLLSSKSEGKKKSKAAALSKLEMPLASFSEHGTATTPKASLEESRYATSNSTQASAAPPTASRKIFKTNRTNPFAQHVEPSKPLTKNPFGSINLVASSKPELLSTEPKPAVNQQVSPAKSISPKNKHNFFGNMNLVGASIPIVPTAGSPLGSVSESEESDTSSKGVASPKKVSPRLGSKPKATRPKSKSPTRPAPKPFGGVTALNPFGGISLVPSTKDSSKNPFGSINLTPSTKPFAAAPPFASASIETTKSAKATSTQHKKLLMLLSSYTTNPNQRSAQDRAITILRGLKIEPEIVDGGDATQRSRRNELFELSGIRAKYPQFFFVDTTAGNTEFLADWEGFEDMHETGSLKLVLGEVITTTSSYPPMSSVAAKNPFGKSVAASKATKSSYPPMPNAAPKNPFGTATRASASTSSSSSSYSALSASAPKTPPGKANDEQKGPFWSISESSPIPKQPAYPPLSSAAPKNPFAKADTKKTTDTKTVNSASSSSYPPMSSTAPKHPFGKPSTKTTPTKPASSSSYPPMSSSAPNTPFGTKSTTKTTAGTMTKSTAKSSSYPPMSSAASKNPFGGKPTKASAEDYKARLIEFYQKHNPSKVGTVDATLEKYKGREAEMFRKLEAKYAPKAAVSKFPQPEGTGPRCYLEFTVGDGPARRVEVMLYKDKAPLAAENFRCLCTGEITSHRASGKPLRYLGSKVHRIVPGFCLQAGDFTRGDGRGGSSIYQANSEHGDAWGKFKDEPAGFLDHSRKGLLSMANSGKNTNSSQFFFTLKAVPYLNGKHVVFGEIEKGMDVLEELSKVKCNSKSFPVEQVKISACGEIDEAGNDRPLLGSDSSKGTNTSSAFGVTANKGASMFGSNTFGSTAASSFGKSSAFNTAPASFGIAKKEKASVFGGTESPFGSSAKSSFGDSALTSSTPVFGSPSKLGGVSTKTSVPAFGGPSKLGGASSNSSVPVFGSPSKLGGASSNTSVPAFGSPSKLGGSGASTFGSSSSKPVFGSTSKIGSAFDANSKAPTATFGSGTTTSGFGALAASQEKGPVFGKAPSFGTSKSGDDAKSGFGFGTLAATNTPAVGFGTLAGASKTPAFGGGTNVPAFGGNNKSKDQASPFGAFSATKDKDKPSPFSAFSTSTTKSPAFGGGTNVPAFGSGTKGKDQTSPFGAFSSTTDKDKPSPFAAFSTSSPSKGFSFAPASKQT